MEKLLGGQEGKAKLFWKAFSFAVSAHEGQKRKSGDAYVSHPCQVAQILAEEMGVRDPETLAAAVLHDTVEDVPEVTNEVIAELFGKNVEAIVDGCTKITHFSGGKQTFYKLVHRKIFSGAASRIEIMLIKLADRLHNLRTMNSMPKHKRQKIAEETLDVYAPMAKVMGLYVLKRELYDLALIYKFPRQSHKVLSAIRKLSLSEQILDIKATLLEEMKQSWIDCDIIIRAKGLWSYYDSVNKVLSKTIESPIDFIIVVDDKQTCYRALGIINQTYPPIPRTIRDFIANPKPTGYQCLHARANIKGQNFLFKIRTQQMRQSSRVGIIREWTTKGKISGRFEKELREMFDILGTDDGLSYRDMIAASGKKEIYTYTPKGDHIVLPNQSIVLDFAFKVHSQIGSRCTHGFIGRKRVQPEYVLQDGDRVEIVCQKKPVFFDPSLQQLCQTPKARSELGKMFRLRRRALAHEIGKSIVQQELKRYGIPFEVLEKKGLVDILEYFDLEGTEDLLLQVGEGRLRLKELVYEIRNGLYVGKQTLQPPTGQLNQITLSNLDPVYIKFSRCCNPVPTEKSLFGLLSERGLSVHNKQCKQFQSLKVQREDVIELRWKLKQTRISKPQTLLILKAINRQRVMMMLGVAPDDMKIIDVISLSHYPAKTSAWEINFNVDNLFALKNILHHFDKADLTYEFSLEQ